MLVKEIEGQGFYLERNYHLSIVVSKKREIWHLYIEIVEYLMSNAHGYAFKEVVMNISSRFVVCEWVTTLGNISSKNIAELTKHKILICCMFLQKERVAFNQLLVSSSLKTKQWIPFVKKISLFEC